MLVNFIVPSASFVILEFSATIPIFLAPVVVIVPLFTAVFEGVVSTEYIPTDDVPLIVISPLFSVSAAAPTIPKAASPSIVIAFVPLLVPCAPFEA